MSGVTSKTLTDPIAVAGIQVRTNNQLEMSGEGKIRGIWERFFGENLLAQMRDRAGESLYVVYSNYESDEYGDYDYLLGVPVSSIDNLPAGMTFAAIPTGEYAVFTSQTGPVAEVVRDAWKEIWSMPHEELHGSRAFIADYEVYDRRAEDPAHAQVEIHLGLLPAAD
jgi:predicted transcriptional regulator YdeE